MIDGEVILLLSDDIKKSLNDDANDDDDDGDDDGFCVIPIPDCFNMDLPPSRTATTSLVVKKSVTSSATGVYCWPTTYLFTC